MILKNIVYALIIFNFCFLLVDLMGVYQTGIDYYDITSSAVYTWIWLAFTGFISAIVAGAIISYIKTTKTVDGGFAILMTGLFWPLWLRTDIAIRGVFSVIGSGPIITAFIALLWVFVVIGYLFGMMQIVKGSGYKGFI